MGARVTPVQGDRAGEWLRVVGAIIVKDIAEALRNRSILSTIISVAGLVVFYQFLPTLTNQGELPRLVVYAPGQSALLSTLEGADGLSVVVADSIDAVQAHVADRELVWLGVVLPSEMPAPGDSLVLPGYLPHWASEAQVLETVGLFESRLTTLLEWPVMIDTSVPRVYTRPDSGGLAMLATFCATLAVLMVGLSVTPHLVLEEKRTRTVDALRISPLTTGQYVLGKAGAGMVYSVLAAVLSIVLYAPLVVHWGAALLVAALGAACSVGLGLLAGSVLRDRQQLVLLVWALVVPLVAGVFLYQEAANLHLPNALVAVLRWLPTVAFSVALRATFALPMAVSAYLTGIGTLAVSAVLLGVAVERAVAHEWR